MSLLQPPSCKGNYTTVMITSQTQALKTMTPLPYTQHFLQRLDYCMGYRKFGNNFIIRNHCWWFLETHFFPTLKICPVKACANNKLVQISFPRKSFKVLILYTCELPLSDRKKSSLLSISPWYKSNIKRYVSSPMRVVNFLDDIATTTFTISTSASPFACMTVQVFFASVALWSY